jgi:hypothetical protein
MKSSAYTLVIIGALALSGCSTINADSSSDSEVPQPAASSAEQPAVACSGVSVVVDFGVLDSSTIAECVKTEGTISAPDVLAEVGVSTEGTAEWGDQIVCRVNDRPANDETLAIEGNDPYVESCASMPAAFAYWALWVKPAPDAEWEYATEGIGTLQSEPGQSLGLVFTTGTETPTPGS